MKFLFTISMSFFITTSAMAQSSSVVINAQTLRKNFLARNIEIQRSLNEVHQAKTQVAIARANLLPSVNLGAVLGGGQNFMLSTVSVLLPFLMPSNWMNLHESQQLLRAQGSAYYMAQLNGYASAYTIYATVVGDMKLRQALKKQYDNFKAIEDELRLPAEMGMIPQEDYLQAQAQAKMALVQVSQLDELIKREKAAIRQMLGLSLSRNIVFEENRVPYSNTEAMGPQTLLKQVQARSPEVAQINSMILAAQAGKFKAAFSFLTGASMSTSSNPMGGFNSVQSNGSVNLGFGYFPALELTNLHQQQLALQRQQLYYEQQQLVEVNLGAMKEAQLQYEYAAAAEDNLKKVYDAEVLRYKMGMIAMSDLVQAGNSLTNSTLARVKASTSIDTLRINLHRLVISDQFKYIPGCEIKSKGTGGGLGSIFRPKEQVTLDQACRMSR